MPAPLSSPHAAALLRSFASQPVLDPESGVRRLPAANVCVSALSTASSGAIASLLPHGAMSLLTTCGLPLHDASRGLCEDLRDNLRSRIGSMSTPTLEKLLRDIITTAPVNPLLMPLLADVLRAIMHALPPPPRAGVVSTTPTPRSVLDAFKVLGEPLALRNVPPDAVLCLPTAARQAVWRAASVRLEGDILYLISQLYDADVAAASKSVQLYAAAGKARSRTAVARELANCVRGDAEMYTRVCKLLLTQFRRSRDPKWAALRVDLFSMFADTTVALPAPSSIMTHSASSSALGASAVPLSASRVASAGTVDPLAPVIAEIERMCTLTDATGVHAHALELLGHIQRILTEGRAGGPTHSTHRRGRAIITAEGLPMTVSKKIAREVAMSVHKFADSRGDVGRAFLGPLVAVYGPEFLRAYAATIAPNKPIDLDSIKRRATSMNYGSLDALVTDMQLLVDNCRKYNGSDVLYTPEVEIIYGYFEAQLAEAISRETGKEVVHDDDSAAAAAGAAGMLWDPSELPFVLCDPQFTRVLLTEVLRAVPASAKAGMKVTEFEGSRACAPLCLLMLGDCSTLDSTASSDIAKRRALSTLMQSVLDVVSPLLRAAAARNSLASSASESALSSLVTSTRNEDALSYLASGAPVLPSGSTLPDVPAHLQLLLRCLQVQWLQLASSVGTKAAATGADAATDAGAAAVARMTDHVTALAAPAPLGLVKRGKHMFSRTSSLLVLAFVVNVLAPALRNDSGGTEVWNAFCSWLSTCIDTEGGYDAYAFPNICATTVRMLQRPDPKPGASVVPLAPAEEARACALCAAIVKQVMLPMVHASAIQLSRCAVAHDQFAKFLQRACDKKWLTPLTAATAVRDALAALTEAATAAAPVPSAAVDAATPTLLRPSQFASPLAYVWTRPDFASARAAYARLVEAHCSAHFQWEHVGLSSAAASMAAGVALGPGGLLIMSSPAPSTPFSASGVWGFGTAGPPTASPFMSDSTPATPGSENESGAAPVPRASVAARTQRALPPVLARNVALGLFTVGSPSDLPSAR